MQQLGDGMRVCRLGVTGLVLSLQTPAFASEPTLDWPYYRLAMHVEAEGALAGRVPLVPWARALNEESGYRLRTPSSAGPEQLQRLLALAALRTRIRIKGPSMLPEKGRMPPVRFALDRCAETWSTVEPGMEGLYNALAQWPERPTCLLQRFGTSEGLSDFSDEFVEMRFEMVGGRKGAKSRVTSWPSSSEKGFLALYHVEGPKMTLYSALVQLDAGWASVVRGQSGSVLLERCMKLDWRGEPTEVAARLVYPKPSSSGAKWLDLGRLPVPPKYMVPETWVGVEGSATCSGINSKAVHVQRGGESLFVEADKTTACGEDGAAAMARNRHPFVLVYDAGAGSKVAAEVADVLVLTTAAELEVPATEVWVGRMLQSVMTLDHIALMYKDTEDAEFGLVLQQSLRLAFPWMAVVLGHVPALEVPFMVQVGQ